MNIIDGRNVSKQIQEMVKRDISNMNIIPGLGIVLVGNRKDSHTYVNMKKRVCADVGIYVKEINIAEDCQEDDILDKLGELNKDPQIHGILVQLPLPSHINRDKILTNIATEKDVEGFHPKNVGLLTQNKLDECFPPCTSLGCMKLLDRYNVELKGKHVVVVGKSEVVGLPVALMCLHRDATVTICHIHTKDLKQKTQQADVLIVACGKPHLIGDDFVKEGVVVIDVGINHIKDDSKKNGIKLVGDVDFDSVSKKADLITPVPGGVGPMTIAMLISNLVLIAKKNKNEVSN